MRLWMCDNVIIKINRQQFFMVYTLMDCRNDVENVPNFALKPLPFGSWFNMSFGHF